MGPYEILQRVFKVVDELKLHRELNLVHPVFLASMFKMRIGDPVFIISIEGFGLNDNISYEEFSVQIVYR